ncbi:FAD-binding oxidoreductase [Nitrospira sp. Kam-Ns4a]
MALQLYTAQVVQYRDLTHDVREIDLRLIEPATITFKAGQFISFDVWPPGASRPVTRPYSIASPPSQRQAVTLVLNLVPGGPGSTYLFSLRPGDEVRFKGVTGAFYLREDFSRDHLFVATGTGIAPIRSMLSDLFERGFSQRATLYWGLRSERDLYYQEELEKLARDHPNFHYVTTLSRPTSGWTGPTGRVTHLIESRVASVANLAVYLCGNSGMIKDVTALLNRRGLCPIYREKYYDDPSGEPQD